MEREKNYNLNCDDNINYMQSMEKQQRFVEVEFSFTVIFQFKHCMLYIFSLRLSLSKSANDGIKFAFGNQ